MVVGRVRIRHEQRGPSEDRDLGERRRARASEHEICGGERRTHVVDVVEDPPPTLPVATRRRQRCSYGARFGATCDLDHLQIRDGEQTVAQRDQGGVEVTRTPTASEGKQEQRFAGHVQNRSPLLPIGVKDRGAHRVADEHRAFGVLQTACTDSWYVTAITSAHRESTLFARPGTEFCSWRTRGTRRMTAASPTGIET